MSRRGGLGPVSEVPFIPEFLVSKATNQAHPTTSAAFKDLTSLFVPQGEWDLTANALYQGDSVTDFGTMILAISTVSDAATGSVDSDGRCAKEGDPPDVTDFMQLVISPFRQIVPVGGQTYYLTSRVEANASSITDVGYKLMARRVGHGGV